MKFNIHQTELNEALQHLVRNTNTKFFTDIRMETKANKLILQATNGEVSMEYILTVDSDTDDVVLINARKFTDIVSRLSDDAEKLTSAEPGKYLFKIYEVNEKTSQADNDYWQVKFETKEGLKVCDNFMFFGKAASKNIVIINGSRLGRRGKLPNGGIINR